MATKNIIIINMTAVFITMFFINVMTTPNSNKTNTILLVIDGWPGLERYWIPRSFV